MNNHAQTSIQSYPNDFRSLRQGCKAFPFVVLLAVALGLAACASKETDPDGSPGPISAQGTVGSSPAVTRNAFNEPEIDPDDGAYYEVTKADAAFFRYGPGQVSGPDRRLAKGERLLMIKRGKGYSNVQLSTGLAGWVNTEDITRAQAQRTAIESSSVRTGSNRPPRSTVRDENVILDIGLIGADEDLGEDMILPEELEFENRDVPAFRY